MRVERIPVRGQIEPKAENEKPQNAFVDFLIERQGVIAPMYEAYEDMRTEINGWKNSKSFNHFVGVLTTVSRKIYASLGRDFDEQQHEQWMRRFFSATWFSLAYIGDAREGFRAMKNVLDQSVNFQIADENDIALMKNESDQFYTEYRTSTDPLRKGYLEKEDQVFEAFEGFFLEDFGRVGDFVRFLSASGFSRGREENRVLLRALAGERDLRRRTTLLDRVRKQVLEREKENPKAETLSRVIKDKARKPQSNVWKWIEFSSRVAGVAIDLASEESILAAARALVLYSPFPPELQADLSFQIDQTVNSTIADAKRGLANYTPRIENVPTNPPPVQANRQSARAQRRNKEVAAISSMKIVQVEENEEEEKTPFSIDIITMDTTGGRSASFSPDTDNYLRKIADKIAKGDARMEADIKTIVESLRDDPFGYGTKKLVAAEVGIGFKSLPLRRLAPDNRPSLHYDHPLTRDIRVAFAIDKKKRAVYIEGIYTHQEFEKRFGS